MSQYMSCFSFTYIVIHPENEKKVFEILSCVFVLKYICIDKYLYLKPSRVFVFIFKYISMYLTPYLMGIYTVDITTEH